VRLVADLAYESGLAVARFQAHSLERGSEPLGQATPDADPVSGRLHVPSDAFGLASTLRAASEAVIALGRFHPDELTRLKARAGPPQVHEIHRVAGNRDATARQPAGPWTPVGCDRDFHPGETYMWVRTGGP
jgi:hypothetical protein